MQLLELGRPMVVALNMLDEARRKVEAAGVRPLVTLYRLDLDRLPEGVDAEPFGEIELRGRYEWNDRGGVVHWTHHDPDGSDPGGWIRHAGSLYR